MTRNIPQVEVAFNPKHAPHFEEDTPLMESLTQGPKGKEEEDDHTSGEEDTDSSSYSHAAPNSECIFISNIVDTKAVLKALNPKHDDQAFAVAAVMEVLDSKALNSPLKPIKPSPAPLVSFSKSSSSPKGGDKARPSMGSIAIGPVFSAYHDQREVVTSRGIYLPYSTSKYDEIPPKGVERGAERGTERGVERGMERGVPSRVAAGQWPGATMEIDEGEQSDECGASTPPHLMPDLATLHVRTSSRSDEKAMLKISTAPHPSNELYLFNQSPERFSPALGRDDAIDSTTFSAASSPLKGIWVNSEVDFDKVVRNLHLALKADEPYTVERKVQPRRTFERKREAEALKRTLQSSLGVEAFDEAKMFLRAVASIQVEDPNSQDDEYLLQQLEGIVGADGLQYMEDIFSLITMEDDIEESQAQDQNSDANMREAIK